VLRIAQPRRCAGEQLGEPRLTLEERRGREILAVKVQEIESEEDELAVEGLGKTFAPIERRAVVI
jgi:hypothetical protein